MNKLTLIISLLLIFSVSCAKKQQTVMETTFPQCSAEPIIGGNSGVDCDYDEYKKEWRMTFWTGWGDCPSGCINKEYYAFYKVDKFGLAYECDEDFENCNNLKSGQQIDPPKPVLNNKTIHNK